MHFIESIEVSGFRGFSSFRANSLGRVNLITGSNNSGKSSLLEAIRLLASGGSVQTFRDILGYREELGSAEADGSSLRNDLDVFATLFTGCPTLSNKPAQFRITVAGNLPLSANDLSVRAGWFVRNYSSDGSSVSFEPAESDLFGDEEVFPALELKAGAKGRRVLPLSRLRRGFAPKSEMDSTQMPCVYLDPFSSRSTSQLAAMWDAIALTDGERETLRALKIASPDIEGVSMVGSDARGRYRTAIVKSEKFDLPVPLRTFGDGVNRLFGIILSICNARNGVLLIDEIENGLHHSIQVEVWRTIFRLARDLNVQVFATSHSFDCIRSFQAAASNSEQDGVLIRLTRKGDYVIPTLFTEDDLRIVSRDDIEVR